MVGRRGFQESFIPNFKSAALAALAPLQLPVGERVGEWRWVMNSVGGSSSLVVNLDLDELDELDV